jgi:Putative transposase/Transposase zinc-binding domain
MLGIKEIFRRFLPEYQKKYQLSPEQAKAVFNIMNCRTNVMGGRVEACEECGEMFCIYNSCGNRHCPLCQNIPREKWVDKRCNDILLAPYFHVVMTVPDELKLVIYQNKELLYNLLYKASSETLNCLAVNKKFLGAQIGFTSVLHTWGQNLDYHPHIHTIVLAGGLTSENQWRCSSKDFFIPVKVLSKVFKGKFMYYLKEYYHVRELKFYGSLKYLEEAEEFQKLVDACYQKNWYTYIKETFSGPVAVIKYLGRYTHRVGISNSRIVSMDDKTVTIEVKSYKDNCAKGFLRLDGTEFIRRFIMHVLPFGFRKLRHYGILGSRNKKSKLLLCRKLTGSLKFKSRFENMSNAEILFAIKGIDVTKCRICGKGRLVTLQTLFKTSASP